MADLVDVVRQKEKDIEPKNILTLDKIKRNVDLKRYKRLDRFQVNS